MIPGNTTSQTDISGNGGQSSIQDQINFDRVAAAIAYIHEHFKEQPSLEQIARAVNLSPFHFQRLFTEWAGTSPKKFLQYISVEHAKKVLGENSPSLFEAATETGLSGTGRLHDLFITVEGMTPGEYKNGGQNLTITWSFTESLFGEVLVASTDRGICFIAFADNRSAVLDELHHRFPNSGYLEEINPLRHPLHGKVHTVLSRNSRNGPPGNSPPNSRNGNTSQPDQRIRNSPPGQQNSPVRSGRTYKSGEAIRPDPPGQPDPSDPPGQINLHLTGTPFQLRVWEALLKIPSGQLTTYGTIATHLGQPKASRAVGSAVGRNPVAWLIPCHRVIQSTGVLGGYHWGRVRKSAMIGYEAASACGKGT